LPAPVDGERPGVWRVTVLPDTRLPNVPPGESDALAAVVMLEAGAAVVGVSLVCVVAATVANAPSKTPRLATVARRRIVRVRCARPALAGMVMSVLLVHRPTDWR
jgi:hypothetical protein